MDYKYVGIVFFRYTEFIYILPIPGYRWKNKIFPIKSLKMLMNVVKISHTHTHIHTRPLSFTHLLHTSDYVALYEDYEDR